jgi:hypothetical protein
MVNHKFSSWRDQFLLTVYGKLMQKFVVFIVSFVVTVYEVVLVVLAVNAAGATLNVWKDLPLFQSNTEFILVLGQVPVIALFIWGYYRRKKALEKDFFAKYGKHDRK